MDSYSDPVTNAQGLLQIALNFSRWCIPSLVGGSQGKCSPLHELQGFSKPVRLCNPQDYYWAFFHVFIETTKTQLISFWTTWTNGAFTPMPYTVVFLVTTAFKTIEMRFQKVSLLTAYLFSSRRNLVKSKIPDASLPLGNMNLIFSIWGVKVLAKFILVS